MTRIVLLLLSLCAVANAQVRDTDTSAGLRLQADCSSFEVFRPDAADGKKEYLIKLASTLTNVSEVELTIPTSTESGHPSCGTLTPDVMVYACFSIGISEDAKGRELHPSPFRFFPVTLKPGESVALPIVEYRQVREGAPAVGKIRVEYVVYGNYAARYGWWSGSLVYTSDKPCGSDSGMVPPSIEVGFEEKQTAEPGATDNPGDAQ